MSGVAQIGPRVARGGQAMIESLLAILFICLLFFGVFQLAHAFASREILRYAATRAARARTVGFNGWMVHKVLRVAAIPNAGTMTVPADEVFVHPELEAAMAAGTPGAIWDLALAASPHSARADFELARLGDYLASPNEPTADQLLDYEDWDDIRGQGIGGNGVPPTLATDRLEVEVRQDYPLQFYVQMLFELAGAVTPAMRDGTLRLRGAYEIENHYPLYLDDEGW